MAPFKRVLIANRGEIALRVIRACHEEGLEAVAVYSDADARSPHVRHADFSVEIGPPPAAIRAMGDKTEARRRMLAAGVPVVPGTSDPVGNADEANRAALEVGY